MRSPCVVPLDGRKGRVGGGDEGAGLLGLGVAKTGKPAKASPRCVSCSGRGRPGQAARRNVANLEAQIATRGALLAVKSACVHVCVRAWKECPEESRRGTTAVKGAQIIYSKKARRKSSQMDTHVGQSKFHLMIEATCK